MERNGAGSIEEGHRGPNTNPTADVSPSSNHHQRNGRHHQQRRGDQPRRKRPREKNNKRSRSRQRQQNRDRSENLPRKDEGGDHSMQIESEKDDFAEPGQIQENKQLKRGPRRQATKRNRNPKQSQRQEKQHQKDLETSTAESQDISNYQNVLEWDSPIGYVPLCEEEAMVKFMFARNGKHERGMLKDKPAFVVSKFRKILRQCAPSMTIPQMCSLRRHHIKLFNQYMDMTKLRLGKGGDILESARIFEVATESFLKKSKIHYLTEKDQWKVAKESNQTLNVTPDFLLPKPIVLRKIQRNTGKRGNSNQSRSVLEERTIHWIEVKMYYGASSIPHGSKGAVGSVLKKQKAYVDTFGEGAILFMMGCGEKLAADLNDIGVTVLDCSGNTVSLDGVHDHQRKWCANDKGQILP